MIILKKLIRKTKTEADEEEEIMKLVKLAIFLLNNII